MSIEATLRYYKVKPSPQFYGVAARYDVDPKVLFLTCMYVARNHPVDPKKLYHRIWAKVWRDLRSTTEVKKAIEAAVKSDILTINEDGDIIPGQHWSIVVGHP